MTLLLALVISGCTLADANDCQEDTPDTYANNANDKCVRTSCVNGKFVDDEPCEFSCKKSGEQFTGCGVCSNNARREEQSANPADPDKQFLCTDGMWKELETERQCEAGTSFQNSPDNKCVKTTCVKGREQKDESCPNSCLLDAMTNTYTGCGDCVNNEKKCEDSNQYKCANGKWDIDFPCTFGCNSDTNLCLECIDDSIRCISIDNNNVFQTCINKQWVKTKTCPKGCSSTGLCIECDNGADRCENNTLQTCIGGIWTTLHACSNGCNTETNTCNPPKIPDEKTNCHPETFEKVCIDGISYECVNNKVKRYLCDEEHQRKCAETAHGHVCSLDESFTKQCSLTNTYIKYVNTCENGKQTVFLCDKDINGNAIAVEKVAPEICIKDIYGQSLLSCDINKKSTEKICKSCEYDANGKAICTTDDTTVSHKLDDPCSDPNAKACDDDVLIQCNGAKYVAVHTNEQGEVFSCSQVNSALYCDERREISDADCVSDCSEDPVGTPYYTNKCANGLISSALCLVGHSGKQGIFTVYTSHSVCNGTEEMLDCSNGDNAATASKVCVGGCAMVMKDSMPEAICYTKM